MIVSSVATAVPIRLPSTEAAPARGRGAAEPAAAREDERAEGGDAAEKGRGSAGTERSTELSQDEQREVADLQDRDREVRAHEAAHLAAAGGYAVSGARFSYDRGPDGRLYAVGGEVSIDVSPVAGDPQATLRKAETVRAAALAPANPSPQDRSVAAEATAMALRARQEMGAGDASGGQRSGDPVEDGGQSALARRLADSGAVPEAARGGSPPLHLVA